MSPETLILSDEDLEHLRSPYSPAEAIHALKLGFAVGLSEMGILPSEFEEMVKSADFIDAPVSAMGGILGAGGQATLGLAAAGALAGGYSGFLRHRIEMAVKGKNDPDITALRNKVRAYQEMKRDLVRSNSLGQQAA